MRLFLLSNNPQGEDMRFDWDGMQTMENHLRTLWNVFRFPLPYMRLDEFDPQETTLEDADKDLELIDEWVLARLQSTKAEMTDHLEEFRQDRAVGRRAPRVRRRGRLALLRAGGPRAHVGRGGQRFEDRGLRDDLSGAPGGRRPARAVRALHQ